MTSEAKDSLLYSVSSDEELEHGSFSQEENSHLLSDLCINNKQGVHRVYRLAFFTSLGVLAVSLFLNVVFLAKEFAGIIDPTALQKDDSRSVYIGLSRSVSKEIRFNSVYWDDNETAADELWSQIPTSTGLVALEKDWTDSKGLPRGDDFPWDNRKSLYFLNAYHILHCLKMIHRAITEAHRGQPQSMLYGHLQHCLNDLREDAICNADDTPRYTRPEPVRITGTDGQQRACRDFSALERWAHNHTACFTFAHGDDPTWNRTARLRFCPPDSPYLPQIRKMYGFSDEWIPEEGILDQL